MVSFVASPRDRSFVVSGSLFNELHNKAESLSYHSSVVAFRRRKRLVQTYCAITFATSLHCLEDGNWISIMEGFNAPQSAVSEAAFHCIRTSLVFLFRADEKRKVPVCIESHSLGIELVAYFMECIDF